MKNFIIIAFSLFSLTVYAQVGINTNSPKASLDISAKTTDGSRPEGLIAPRLTGNQIQAGDAQYGTAQKGAILYATSAATSPSIKTANITAEGYYYFDGSAWQKITGGASAGDTTNDAWINDTANSMVKLGTNADGTARAAGTDVTVNDNGNFGIGVSIPGSKLQVNGSFGINYLNVTSTTYTLTSNDYYINYNGNSDAVFTLPVGTSASCNCKGRTYEIVNNTNYNITVNAAPSESINNNTSFLVTAKTAAKIVNTSMPSGSTWANVYYSPIEFSTSQGSITLKTLYNSALSDATKTVRIGRFEIRINNNVPEYRLIYPPSANVVVYRSIEENWQGSGYYSDTLNHTFTTSNWNTYQPLGFGSGDGISFTEKNTIWLAYPQDSTLVKVEILSMGDGSASTTYGIICTQY